MADCQAAVDAALTAMLWFVVGPLAVLVGGLAVAGWLIRRR